MDEKTTNRALRALQTLGFVPTYHGLWGGDVSILTIEHGFGFSLKLLLEWTAEFRPDLIDKLRLPATLERTPEGGVVVRNVPPEVLEFPKIEAAKPPDYFEYVELALLKVGDEVKFDGKVRKIEMISYAPGKGRALTVIAFPNQIGFIGYDGALPRKTIRITNEEAAESVRDAAPAMLAILRRYAEFFIDCSGTDWRTSHPREFCENLSAEIAEVLGKIKQATEK